MTRTWLRAKKNSFLKSLRPDGGTGRRAGLKIRFSQESGSSTLPLGTIGSQPVSKYDTGFPRLVDGDRIVREAETHQTPHIPVDMSKWVAYSLPLSVMNEASQS